MKRDKILFNLLSMVDPETTSLFNKSLKSTWNEEIAPLIGKLNRHNNPDMTINGIACNSLLLAQYF